MDREERLAALGYQLPAKVKPQGAYATATRCGKLLFTAGQTPRKNGALVCTGRVGAELDLEEAQEAARICAVNCLGIIKSETGSLEEVARILKMTGYVASAEDFAGQTQVIDGASRLLAEVLGEDGIAARSAVGVSALPGGAPCEIELIVELKE